MVLLIDNYDSFVHNLGRYLRRLGADVVVLRNDAPELMELARQSDSIVISPGPCGPEQAGDCIGLVEELSGKIPILGICLGHQIICQALGGQVIRARRPIHGMCLPIQLSPSPIFSGLPSVARFARYHSLVADLDSLPKCLRVIALSLEEEPGPSEFKHDLRSKPDAGLFSSGRPSDSEIMAVEHTSHLTFGVQFHPESILSEHGYRILANFLSLAGAPSIMELPQSDLQIENSGAEYGTSCY